jgi:copper transport protein
MKFMIRIVQKTKLRRSLSLAFLGAILLMLVLPAVAGAQLAPGANPIQGIMGNNSANNAGTLDATGVFNLLAITLADLGAIFWVGAQLWLSFVLQTTTEKHPDERTLNLQVEQRFERRFSLPTLALLLLANLGVLYGQALTLTGGDWGAAFSLRVLSAQATSGHPGPYWLMRMIVLLLALIVGIYMVRSKQRPRIINQTLPLLNLFLGAMLFIAMAMSGDATGVTSVASPYAVVIDWLHLMASALWVGGMIYILMVYLPVLKPHSLDEQARSLLATLPRYSPLAIAGIVIMAISGPLNATFHLTSIDLLFTTAYGRTLAIKVLLVGTLLLIGAYHDFWLRPRLKKEYQKYTYAKGRLEKIQTSAKNEGIEEEQEPPAENQLRGNKLLTQQVKLRDGRLTKKTTLLTQILRWEPWLGVAVIVCVGLMSVFAAALTSATATQQQPASSAFNSTAKTGDGKYIVSLNVSPDRFGSNVFTVQVTDASTGKLLGANEVGVTIYTTMLDMDMGTDSIDLQPDGKGGFSATQNLSMGGNWGIEVQVRASDNQLHTVSFKVVTPF